MYVLTSGNQNLLPETNYDTNDQSKLETLLTNTKTKLKTHIIYCKTNALFSLLSQSKIMLFS